MSAMLAPNDADEGEQTPLLASPGAGPPAATLPVLRSGPGTSRGHASHPQEGPSSSSGNSPDDASASGPAWGKPAGLEPRGPNDANLLLFRHAVGINSSVPADAESSSLEQSRKTATGIYRRVLHEKRSKTLQFNVLSAGITACHVVQILVGAALTALGARAATHTVAITTLGATNTVLAGVFALLKGQGLPDRLHKDAVEFRRVQDWIEQTDALLVSGVLGRDRKDVGLLVEAAFKKYNAALASEENNKPDSYVRQQAEGDRGVEEGPEEPAPGGRRDSGDSEGSGNAIVRLNVH